MEPLRLDTLAAQVVAWHNRHPLARRITAAQVHSMGYVVLPGMQVCVPDERPGLPAHVEAAQAASPPALDDTAQAVELLAPADEEAAAATTAPAEDAAAERAPDAAPDAAPFDDQSTPEPETPPLQQPDGAGALAAIEPAEAPPEGQADAEAADVAADPVVETAPDADPDAASDVDPDVDPDTNSDAAPDADPVAEIDTETDADPIAPVDPAPLPESAAKPPEPAGEVEAVALPSLRERLTARPAHAAPAEPSALAGAFTRAPANADPHAPLAQAAAGAGPRADALRPGASNPHSQPFRVAFSEQFLDHGSAPQVAQWAQAHACVLAVPLPVGASVRQVVRDAALSAPRPGLPERPVDLLLRTATLEMGRHRQRLLLGPGVDPAVLGRRLWSLPRVAVACLPLLLLPLTGGLAWWLGAQSARQGPAMAEAGHAVAAASAAVSANVSAPGASAVVAAADHPASNPASHPAADPASHPANPDAGQAFTAYTAQAASSAQAAAQAAALAAAAAAEPPVDTEPRLGRVVLPPLGPLFADERFEPTRQRRLAARAARAAPALAAAAAEPAAAAETEPSHPAANGPAKPPANALAAPAASPAPAAYALTTRALRTAAESEQVQAAMRTLLALTADRAAKVERVPVGDDWRVMGGPFASRAAAEQARALLLARGVKTEVTEIPPPSALAAAAATLGR